MLRRRREARRIKREEQSGKEEKEIVQGSGWRCGGRERAERTEDTNLQLLTRQFATYAKDRRFHGLTGIETWQFEVLASMSVSKKILLLRFNIETINYI